MIMNNGLNDVQIYEYTGKQAMANVNNIISTWNKDDMYLYVLERKPYRYKDEDWNMSKVYVAKIGKIPAAFALMEADGNVSIGTRSGAKYRGTGLAKICLEKLLAWFNSKENKKINIAIWGSAENNLISKHLANKYGFKWSKKEAPSWSDIEADWFEKEKEPIEERIIKIMANYNYITENKKENKGMSIFENIFEESRRQSDKVKFKKENRVNKTTAQKKTITESRKRVVEDLYDDVSDIRRELDLASPEEEAYVKDIGKKVADMLNARINNEMDIDNPGFKAIDTYQDDDYFTVEVEDGDGYVENGSAEFRYDETTLIKEIVDNIMTNLQDGEYKGKIKEESDADEEELDDYDYDAEGYIAKDQEEQDEELFDEIDEDTLTYCDLLTAEEFEEYKDLIPAIDIDWWLQDAAEDATENVQYVDENNEIVETGKGIYDYLGVRPVVTGEFEVGQEFSFNEYNFVAFSEEKAITTGIIGTMDFDNVSNNYNRSLIKSFIHDWAGGYDISEHEETDDEETKEITDDKDLDFVDADDFDDGEFIIEAKDDWQFGYSLWK